MIFWNYLVTNIRYARTVYLPLLVLENAGTLAVSILGNALAGKGVIRVDEGVRRAGQIFSCCTIL